MYSECAIWALALSGKSGFLLSSGVNFDWSVETCAIRSLASGRKELLRSISVPR